MSQETAQRVELAVGCIIFGLLVVRFSQKRRISFRYTVGWLVLCALGVFAALLIPLITPLADLLQISPTVLLVVIASSGSALLFLQITVSISGTQRRVESLAQENALLREKLENIESKNQQ